MDKKLDIRDKTKRNDRTEVEHERMFRAALGSNFTCAYAFTKRDGGTFYSDYHIKLAVRDRAAFWLSSGNWQSSNQPQLDPLGEDQGNSAIDDYNREWHVIGEHAGLSDVWAKFLEWDLVTALQPRPEGFSAPTWPPLEVFAEDIEPKFHYKAFFQPKDFELDAAHVYPLLTPDNYIEGVTRLVTQAKKGLLVQNQSLSFLKEEGDQDFRFTELTKLLARKSHELSDFRLILRDPGEFGGSAADVRAILRAKEFDINRIHFQIGCHNKGMIVDDKKVLIGSHNLTNAGTTANRDASVIVEHEGVAGYYREIFEHDWNESDVEPRSRRMMLAAPGELAPPGMRRYSFWDFIDTD